MTLEQPARNLLYGHADIFKIIISKGEMFGEQDLFLFNEKRINSARSISEDTVIYCTSINDFSQFLEKYNIVKVLFYKRAVIKN